MIEIHSINALKSYILSNSENCKIFAFTGHIGTGKNYVSFEVGKQLQEYGFNVMFTSFASKLKKLILYSFGYLKDGSIMYNLDRNTSKDRFVRFIVEKCLRCNADSKLIHQIEEKYNELQEIIESESQGNLIVRKLLQSIGEFVRSLDSNTWVNLLCDNINDIYENMDFIFITDLRYPNEYDGLKNNFSNVITIRVVAPIDKILERLGISEDRYLNLLKHSSEINIDKLTNINAIYINN